MITGKTNISEHANFHLITADYKTMRLRCIMQFWKGSDSNLTNEYSLMRFKGLYEMSVQLKSATYQSRLSNINRQLILFGDHRDALYMVGMFMGYKDCPDFRHGKSEAAHPLFSFTAAYPRIYKDGILVI